MTELHPDYTEGAYRPAHHHAFTDQNGTESHFDVNSEDGTVRVSEELFVQLLKTSGATVKDVEL